MTVKEYNENFYPQFQKALSFIHGMEHALQKCDDNACMQMKVIGWDVHTKEFLLDVLKKSLKDAQDSYRCEMI